MNYLLKLATLQKAIKHVLRSRLVKRAETMSMPFTPNNPTTNSFDSLVQQAAPGVSPSPQRAVQHPGIPDINQRYSSKLYPRDRPNRNIVQPAGWGIPEGLTEETANQHLNNLKNNDLLRFLISRGYPTQQEPYIVNTITHPEDFRSAYYMPPKPGDRQEPDYGSVHVNTSSLPFPGHEYGHTADINKKINDLGTKYKISFPPAAEVLRQETAATLGHYDAMKKALINRPDIYERYLHATAPALMPALAGYYVIEMPNAIKEVAPTITGATNALLSMTNPNNWNSSSLKKSFNQGRRQTQKVLGKPAPRDTFNRWGPLQEGMLQRLNRIADQGADAAKSDVEPMKSIISDMRDYAKQNYGFNNDINWYNPELSAVDNVINNTEVYDPEFKFREDTTK